MLAGPGTDSGTFDYFTDAINGEEGASRADYTASEDDNVTVQAVAGDKGALGYLGYTYYEENSDTLKAVEIDGGSGCVAPSAETAQDGTYTPALAPALHLREARVATGKPQVAGFTTFYLDNIDEITKTALFIPPTPRSGRDGQVHARSRPSEARQPPVSTPDVHRRWARSRISGCGPAGGVGARTPSRSSSESAPSISIATTVGIVFALRRARDRVLPRDQVHGLHHGNAVGSAVRAGELRRRAAARGHALGHDLGHARLRPVRSRCRDLHERVRARPGSAGRSSPFSSCSPASRRSSSGTSRSCSSRRCSRTSASTSRARSARSSAGLVVGVLVLPTVASLSEDAMIAVPHDLRTGAYALGVDAVQGLDATSWSRPRSPASSPASCWPSPASSARRWSS